MRFASLGVCLLHVCISNVLQPCYRTCSNNCKLLNRVGQHQSSILICSGMLGQLAALAPEERPQQTRNVVRQGPLTMARNNNGRAYSFQSSSVSYGGPNGTYYSSSATRRLGPNGVQSYSSLSCLFTDYVKKPGLRVLFRG